MELLMLEKPSIEDNVIIDALRQVYGLDVSRITFLPLGADLHTAVYRATTDKEDYFIKLRSGGFNETTVTLPHYLFEQGVSRIIPALSTHDQRLWVDLDDTFKLTVYPFVEGENGYETPLFTHHWTHLGRILKEMHAIQPPLSIITQIQHETFSSKWIHALKQIQADLDKHDGADAITRAFIDLLQSKHPVIHQMIQRAEGLESMLRQRPKKASVLCHADVHAGNLLIDAGDTLYLIDWDTLIFAPKERDLMFIGYGLGGGWLSVEDEQTAFYLGYGETDIDAVAWVYYRYERVIQDIAEYYEQVVLTSGEGEDRADGLAQLTRMFAAGNVVDIALRSERFLPQDL
jgi:spectinomycin phosphotransferase